MGVLLEKTLERSLAKGWIQKSDFEPITKEINRIAAKYRIPEEMIVKMVLIEAEGFNSRLVSPTGCTGITQVCSFSTVVDQGGLKEVGGSLKGLANAGPVKQLQLWDKYHMDYWTKRASRPPKDNAELYIINLFPAAFLKAASGKLGRDTPVKVVSPSEWGRQAMVLYADYDPVKKYSPRLESGNSNVTLNSIERGLNYKIVETLGSEFSSLLGTTSPIPNSIGSQPGDYSSPTGALPNLVADSALLKGENCPPPPYTQQDRIIYTGCSPKINSVVPSGGNSLGYPAPAVGTVNGTPGSTSTSTYKYDGPLSPGGFIMPAKGTITSKWGMRWGKMHRGWDIANGVGTPIVAMANGVVTRTVTGCPPSRGVGDSCGDFYGNQIIIDHGGSMSTMSAHLSEVLVREGQQVKQGELIGKMGSTGSSTGSHVHTEIRLNGAAQDPAKYLKG
ncbi:M23 family metallopeptidase [Calothrix sp. FACHB-1219]|uniref:M23 family metallopeptidase n=1 Tax=unclassified Calothrix TaxID=2619626 RepID=UPI001686F4EF|nr:MULTISPECIES: M23 family metallopeptidase [unclassified Calothrix]MBD2201543.1 M23 family metallopeptidase [Calothrix sp. FACHB-168]MBD2217229.1 M23 family metallopeptidase [Calothrix sp. FACHB-1219]